MAFVFFSDIGLNTFVHLEPHNHGVTTISTTYYDKLIGLGFSGTLGMMQVAYLAGQGFTGDHNQALYQFLGSLGYTREGVMNRLKQKQNAEGFVTIGEMMTKTGIIPV